MKIEIGDVVELAERDAWPRGSLGVVRSIFRGEPYHNYLGVVFYEPNTFGHTLECTFPRADQCPPLCEKGYGRWIPANRLIVRGKAAADDIPDIEFNELRSVLLY